MTAFEPKEMMQNYSEAPMRCVQSKVHPYSLRCKGKHVEGFPEIKDETSSHAGGAVREPDGAFSNASFAFRNKGYNRSMHQPSNHVCSSVHPDLQKAHQARQNHFHAVESHFSPMNHEGFPADNRFQYVPFGTSSQNYPSDFHRQDFQYFVVIDFEATCDKERNPHPQEIIEFPSVIVNSATGRVEEHFQCYVRPTHNKLLSDFCKELTGIQQFQVDGGVLLIEALLMHDRWLEDIGVKYTNFAVVTWSNWDCRVMLESECRFKKIPKPTYFNRWINLRVPFNEVFGGAKCNLKGAVELAGIVWEGRAHCGLDDAKNTARLLAHIMHRGFRFTITNSLMWKSAECPWTIQHFLDHQFTPTPPQLTHRMKRLPVPLIQFRPFQIGAPINRPMQCFCGVKTSKQMIRKPGPKHGSFFFGCGNWSATRGALCPYFEWATS